MSFDPEDPRLTAYALGELDESERQAIAAEIDDHPEALQFVEELRHGPHADRTTPPGAGPRPGPRTSRGD